MAIIAGIFSRQADVQVPPQWRVELAAVVSRDAADEVQVFDSPCCFLVKLDFGAYGCPALEQLPDGSAIAVAGHPHLDGPCGGGAPRSSHARILAEAGGRDDWSLLRGAQGTFAAAYYDAVRRALVLINDKVGVRGIFYWFDDRYVIFASALRVLESFAAVPKRVDVRGAAETAAFGYPLGERTGYSSVRRLPGGGLARWTAREFWCRPYWRWDQIAPSRLPEAQLLEQAHARFSAAIRRRSERDTGAIALLSGGLDSRVVVAGLQSLPVKVHTCNFSLPGTRDRVLAERFAAAAGTHHSVGKWLIGEPFFLSLAAFLQSAPRPPFPVERPRMVWSGDGGSVGLGHVYIRAETAALLRTGDRAGAIESYARLFGCGLPLRLLRPRVREVAANLVQRGVGEELARLEGPDPIRNFHIFLLLNDQRWHMFQVYEDIDRHRLEPQLPFFDGAFLETILSVPSELCLHHRLYTKWLAGFPAVVTSVPWQTYPGAEPCPLPVPADLRDQWSPQYRADLARRNRAEVLSKAARVLAEFPSDLLDPLKFRAAVAAHRWRLRDYAYVVHAAAAFQRYWAASGGQVDWDAAR